MLFKIYLFSIVGLAAILWAIIGLEVLILNVFYAVALYSKEVIEATMQRRAKDPDLDDRINELLRVYSNGGRTVFSVR